MVWNTRSLCVGCVDVNEGLYVQYVSAAQTLHTNRWLGLFLLMLFNLTQNKWKQTEPSVSRFNTSDSQKLQNTSALDLNRTDAKSELSFLKWKYYLFLIFFVKWFNFETAVWNNQWQTSWWCWIYSCSNNTQTTEHPLVGINNSFPVAVWMLLGILIEEVHQFKNSYLCKWPTIFLYFNQSFM